MELSAELKNITPVAPALALKIAAVNSKFKELRMRTWLAVVRRLIRLHGVIIGVAAVFSMPKMCRPHIFCDRVFPSNAPLPDAICSEPLQRGTHTHSILMKISIRKVFGVIEKNRRQISRGLVRFLSRISEYLET